jgi:hypothetical protein
VRSVDLARAVTEVLGRVPRLVGGGEVEHQAVPLVVVEGTALDVATVGPWTATVDVYDRKVKVAAVRASAARTLAASHDRKAAVHLNREAPAGCVWALYLDGTRGPQRAWEVAVLPPSSSPHHRGHAMKPPPEPPPELHLRLVKAVAALRPGDRATLRDQRDPRVQGRAGAGAEARVLAALPTVANDNNERGRRRSW